MTIQICPSRVIDTCATDAWHRVLTTITDLGMAVGPRGLETREVIMNTATFPLVFPVVTDRRRRLNYSFMAAEALWMLDGDNRVAPLAAVNPNMAKFSDDGETLWGAYGVRLAQQRQHVIDSLRRDPSTRQAVVTTWVPNPPLTKDVPCTVAWTFFIRDGQLHLQVHMRSSDAWLGAPYDFFSFSVVALSIVNELRWGSKTAQFRRGGDTRFLDLRPGYLSWSAVSSHLYDEHLEAAMAIVDGEIPVGPSGQPAPAHAPDPEWLRSSLRACASKTGEADAWWGIRPPAPVEGPGDET